MGPRSSHGASERGIPRRPLSRLQQATRTHSREVLLYPALALLAFAATLAIDALWLEGSLIREGPPDFGPLYLARTTLIAAGSAAFFASLRQPWPWRGVVDLDPELRWAAWGTLGWFPELRGAPARRAVTVRRLVVSCTGLLALAFVLVFLASPARFARWGMEDGPVETSSAAALFVCFAIFAGIALRMRAEGARRLQVGLAAALALAFFVIGMEEVSWFQRVIGIETPEALLGGNRQAELNLHNFKTDAVENAYYFSMFALLVLGPFLVPGGIGTRAAWIERFLPAPFVAYAGAFFVAFNYDMWNVPTTQVAFFVTIAILVHQVRRARARGERGVFEGAVLAVVLLSQLAFLALGERFVRLHDVTEYKELLIPLACAIYAVDVAWRPEPRSRPAAA